MTGQERKSKTELMLKELNISINIGLPIIEEENEAKIRSEKEIAERILILTYLVAYADTNEKDQIINYLKTEKLWEAVSKFEKKLFTKSKLTEKDKINISWHTEIIYLLLWSIQKIDDIGLPIEQCDTEEIFNILPEYLEDTSDFISTAKVRTNKEILDKSDLIYRLHWAVRQAELDDDEIPANIDAEVIEEWHYAINWITYYDDNWDEILTDT